MRASSLLLLCSSTVSIALAAQSPPPPNGNYLVLAAVPAEHSFDAAAQVLAKRHHADVVRFDPQDLEPLRATLTAAAPRYVAIVLRPEQLDFGLQRRFLQLATELDDDPFVDFAFGYVTGATADEAVALARRGAERQPQPIEHGIATVAGGVDKSVRVERPKPLRNSQLSDLQLYCAGAEAFPATGRDLTFLQQNLAAVSGRDVVTFVGHGMPREVLGGPTFQELAGLDLNGAVVLDVACYTGVTHRYHEDDHQQNRTVTRTVPLAESFCLAVLRTGVVGYTAYLCPRPAGPELDTDFAALVVDGLSLGETRRRDYDKTVLGFLGFAEPRLRLDPPTDGAPLKSGRDAVRDIMLEGATGGVVFGDPACVPFVPRDRDAPVGIECKPLDGAIQVTARAGWQAAYTHCSDPTARFGDGLAMKVYARVPLGDRHVTEVVVDELKIGKAALPSRVLWALETDHGERFLQLKVNFPRPQKLSMESLRLTARVLTTADAAQGKLRGGEVMRAAPVSSNLRSRTLEPFLLDLAKQREVSAPAMQEALDASARLLGDETTSPDVLQRLAARGSEGFRAVVVLLEVGHVHVRTVELLAATWRPGDERHLFALASGPSLPNYASWVVLEGLGVADTPPVRTFLTERLASERDAGLYLSAAKALARLGERAAIGPIADRLLEAHAGWQGVDPQLVATLGAFGGAEAVTALERIVRAGGRSGPVALAVLRRLDAAAAARLEGGSGGR